MAILKGAQAEEWIKKNPGRAYKDVTSGASAQPQELGILGSLLKSITQPFRMGGGVAQEFGYTLADLIRMAQGKEQLERPEAYAGLSQEESQRLSGDPLREGLKSGAGVLSYAVPAGAAKGITSVGGRIGSAALRGGAAGTMGGFALSEEGKELGSALKGAGLGALMGGALQGVGEAARGIKTAKTTKTQGLGTDIRGKAIGLDSNKLATKRGSNVKSATQGKQVIKDYFNTMDELGLPTNTSELASLNSDKALQLYGQKFDDVLSRADDSLTFSGQNTKQIIGDVDKAFKNNPSVMKSPIYQELTGDLIDLGNTYKPSQLNMVREKAREMVNFASAQKGMANSQRAASQMFDTIDDFFKASVPESAEVLSKMKNIYTVRPVLQGKAPTVGSIKVGTASTNVAVPSGGLQERIPEAIGRGLQGVPQTQATGQLPQVLQSLISGGQRAIPAVAGMAGGAQAQQPIQPQQQLPQGIDGQGINALNLMLAQEVLSGNISATEANAVLSLLGMGSGGELSSNQSKAQALQGSLDSLRSVWEGSGAGARIMETLGLNIGTGARSLDQAKAVVAENLGRLQSQGAINEQERVAFLQMLPNVWDSPEVVQQKFDNIQGIINAY